MAAGGVQNSLSWGAPHPGSFFSSVGGVDEVGRGCIAGPVVAAALWVPPFSGVLDHPVWTQVRDSKALSGVKRQSVADVIWKMAESKELFASVAWADENEIAELNILHATGLAMERAVVALERGAASLSPRILWRIDGHWVPSHLRTRAEPLIKGDTKELCIAGASILAKVYRDAWMIWEEKVQKSHQRFSFGVHKGYPTPAHLNELAAWGVTSIHRREFAPVKKYLGFQ